MWEFFFTSPFVSEYSVLQSIMATNRHDSLSEGCCRSGDQPGLGWRYVAGMSASALFFCAAALVMWPVGGRQVAALIPLFVALMYVLGGIWNGPRYVVAGIGVAALTLAGFLLLREHFLLWMAGVGGGSLILAGVWLRRV